MVAFSTLFARKNGDSENILKMEGDFFTDRTFTIFRLHITKSFPHFRKSRLPFTFLGANIRSNIVIGLDVNGEQLRRKAL